MIGIAKQTNRQNDGKWLARDDPARRELILQTKNFDSHIHIWCGFNALKGVIGPYPILEFHNPDHDPNPSIEASKKSNYRFFLENVLHPELERLFGYDLENV